MKLIATGLRHAFDGSRVFDIERVALESGACAVLEGANGVGKSTLLRILSGLLEPQQGRFGFGSESLGFGAVRKSLLRHVVYLHQSPYLFDRSVRANVAYGLARRPGAASRSVEVDGALEWCGLADRAASNARELSGGERRRLALARARIVRPAFLMLDEPFAGLDAAARNRTRTLLEELVDGGTGLLITTHEASEQLPPAAQRLRLQEGRLSHIEALDSSPNP